MKNKSIICIWFITILIGCNSESGDNKNKKPNYIESEFVNLFKPEKQEFTWDGRSDTIFVTSKGFEFNVQKSDSCKVKYAKYVITEYMDIPTIILNNLSTNSNIGIPLDSKGMFFIEVTDEKGQILKRMNLPPISLRLNKSLKEKYMLFNRNDSANRAWQPIIHVYPANLDSIQAKAYILMKYGGNFGWLNIDKFIDGDTTHFYMKLDPEYEHGTFYLVYSNYKSVSTSYSLNNGVLKFHGVIKEEPFSVIALGKKNDLFMLGIIESNSENKNLSLENVEYLTKGELERKLRDKFGSEL